MFGFEARQQAILHLTWVAFFLSFVAWFNLAPFNTTLMATLGLTEAQVRVLMISNVALTIPARIVIGSFIDAFGPKRVFVWLLVYSAAVCFGFATATTFPELLITRLLMGIVGAGFVVGIKMIAEWFPPERMGTAQGLYAGWGNFGAAAAVFALPLVAASFAPETGWRVAAAFSGLLCLIWAGVYHRFAAEVPERAAAFPVGLEHAVEVTSRHDLVLQVLLLIPVYTALGLLTMKLGAPPAQWLAPTVTWGILFVLSGLFAWNAVTCVRFNIDRVAGSTVPEKRYAFKQVVILSLVYALTFGSELAVISMFPEFLETTFGLSVLGAGALGASFAVFNLVTRPSGGWLSDKLGRRRVLFVLVAGAAVCYWIMGFITADWPVGLAIALAVVCSVLIQAGNGACFAMVPLIRRDLTGQLAGMVGAYGNVGAVMFLTILSFVEATVFFQCIAAYALIVTLSLVFLDSFRELHASFNSNRRV